MKRLFVLLIIIFTLSCGYAFAGTKTITLGWDYPTPPADLGGFKIYQSSVSGQYDMTKPALVVSDPALRQATLPSALADGNYFWVMTAFDKSGNESLKSPELAYVLDATAPPAPGTLRVVVSVMVGQ